MVNSQHSVESDWPDISLIWRALLQSVGFVYVPSTTSFTCKIHWLKTLSCCIHFCRLLMKIVKASTNFAHCS